MNIHYKNYNHLIGSWQWEKTKFLQKSVSKIKAKYKSPKTENSKFSIEINEKGELRTYINSMLQKKI